MDDRRSRNIRKHEQLHDRLRIKILRHDRPLIRATPSKGQELEVSTRQTELVNEKSEQIWTESREIYYQRAFHWNIKIRTLENEKDIQPFFTGIYQAPLETVSVFAETIEAKLARASAFLPEEDLPKTENANVTSIPTENLLPVSPPTSSTQLTSSKFSAPYNYNGITYDDYWDTLSDFFLRIDRTKEGGVSSNWALCRLSNGRLHRIKDPIEKLRERMIPDEYAIFLHDESVCKDKSAPHTNPFKRECCHHFPLEPRTSIQPISLMRRGNEIQRDIAEAIKNKSKAPHAVINYGFAKSRDLRGAITKRDRCCVVTGCQDMVGETVAPTLEWAHVVPQSRRELLTPEMELVILDQSKTVPNVLELNEPINSPSNGMLLRSDIHTHFDLFNIGIHPYTYRIHAFLPIQTALIYHGLDARRHLPEERKMEFPPPEILKWHWTQCQLRMVRADTYSLRAAAIQKVKERLEEKSRRLDEIRLRELVLPWRQRISNIFKMPFEGLKLVFSRRKVDTTKIPKRASFFKRSIEMIKRGFNDGGLIPPKAKDQLEISPENSTKQETVSAGIKDVKSISKKHESTIPPSLEKPVQIITESLKGDGKEKLNTAELKKWKKVKKRLRTQRRASAQQLKKEESKVTTENPEALAPKSTNKNSIQILPTPKHIIATKSQIGSKKLNSNTYEVERTTLQSQDGGPKPIQLLKREVALAASTGSKISKNTDASSLKLAVGIGKKLVRSDIYKAKMDGSHVKAVASRNFSTLSRFLRRVL